MFTVRLHGLAFGDGPYTATTDSTLMLTLRREVTRVRAIRVRSVGVRSFDGRRVTRAG